MKRNSRMGFSTRAVHHGYDPHQHFNALTPPIYLSSTFVFRETEDGRRLFAGEDTGFTYARVGNPTNALLEARMASLEGAEAGLATASGMGAIAATLWSLVSPGDKIIADLTLYGCTYAFLHEGIGRFGVEIEHVDLTDIEAATQALSGGARVVLFETPANPNMRIVDIEAISRIAHRAGAIVLVDNTYATPYLQRPIEQGADIVVHSATKYLGGHGDLLAGIVVGSAETIERIRFYGLKDMTGAVMSAFDAFLIMRGLRTLEVRMDRHCRTAATVAQLLEQSPGVAQVYYPGSPRHPQHALAARQMSQFGGIVAFELQGGREAGTRFMDALQLCSRAVSLGDTETLIQHPASMTHATYPPGELAKHGISEGLVRISLGLENEEDIIADLEAALRSLAGRQRPRKAM